MVGGCGSASSSTKPFGAAVDIVRVSKCAGTALTRIVVDARERRSGVPELLESHDHVELSFANLSVGDYIVDDRAVFERKAVADFAKSIVDTRLFRQASRLARAPQRAAFIIEGTLAGARARVPREAMQGALISVSLVFDVPVLRAVDVAESAKLILYAARQLADLERGPTVWRHGKPRRPWNRRLHLLQSLPGIGRERAQRLLEHFGTIERCISATEIELRRVPGIGSKTARAIRRLVSES